MCSGKANRMAECLESTGSMRSFANAPSIGRIIDAIFNGKNEKSRSKNRTLLLTCSPKKLGQLSGGNVRY